MASHALINSAPSSASAALDMGLYYLRKNIAPLKGESAESLESNQWPPARLLALRSLR